MFSFCLHAPRILPSDFSPVVFLDHILVLVNPSWWSCFSICHLKPLYCEGNGLAKHVNSVSSLVSFSGASSYSLSLGSSLPVFSVWLFLKEPLHHFPHFFLIFKSAYPEAVTELVKCLPSPRKAPSLIPSTTWNPHDGTHLALRRWRQEDQLHSDFKVSLGYTRSCLCF